MELEKPLISIVIPSFNRASLISETLSSVWSQTYTNWECIIVDDGSKDGTIEIINIYLQKDNRFKLYLRNREPKGAPTCRNMGLNYSNGHYVLFLDSDDLLVQKSLSERIDKVLSGQIKHDFYVFPVKLFTENIEDCQLYLNKSFPANLVLEEFLNQNMPWVICSVLWRRDILLKLEGFDENLLSWQDWDLHVRALLSNFSFESYDPGSMSPIYYRQNVSNSISNLNGSRSIILNRIGLFLKIYRIVQSDRGISKNTKILFAKLFFFNALKASHYDLSLFKEIKLLKLVPGLHYYFWTFYGWCYFMKFNFTIRFLDAIAYKIMGYHIFDFYGRTFRNYSIE